MHLNWSRCIDLIDCSINVNQQSDITTVKPSIAHANFGSCFQSLLAKGFVILFCLAQLVVIPALLVEVVAVPSIADPSC